MASKSKKRKRSLSPEPDFSDPPPIQKLKIKPMPKIPPSSSSSGKKSSKKRKQDSSPTPTTSVSPTGDWGEDGGLKMKFILSPKKTKEAASPGSSALEEKPSPKGSGKGKKKEKQIKAKLFFEDQVLTLDGDTVTHQDMITPGKKRKAGVKQSPEEAPKSSKKKKKDDKVKVKEEAMIPPFTKVSKSAERSKIKSLKAESDSGYSDTPPTGKGKKMKAKLQTLEEQPVPSPQASDVSRDSFPKKKKKEKDKKKKKMFKFKGDRNRFLNVKGSSDEEGDDSFSRSLHDDDSFGASNDFDDEYETSIKKEKSKEMDRLMMPQMPVPDYNLEKQAAEGFANSMRAKSRKVDRNEGEIQSSRAEDLISQLTAFGSDMETIYPSYMMAPEEEKEADDGGWSKKKKKKDKKLLKEKKKKKKKQLSLLERDDQGNVKYVVRKTKLSGYMLWCRSYRATFVSQNPGLDFSTISRRMGALWQTLDEEEKKVWRKREITVNTRVPLKRLNKTKEGATFADSPPFHLKQPDKVKKSKKLAVVAKKKAGAKKKMATPTKVAPPKWAPIDCAAYMRLLGESLSDVGGKLQTHRDNIEVHGSISVLLDSMLCALGPLLCLTEQVPELGTAVSKKTKTAVLENIAYIMPGL